MWIYRNTYLETYVQIELSVFVYMEFNYNELLHLTLSLFFHSIWSHSITAADGDTLALAQRFVNACCRCVNRKLQAEKRRKEKRQLQAKERRGVGQGVQS